MSSNWRSSRRPSAPDTTEPPAPRPRTTSGSMAMFASVFGLGPKAKSREKLRTGTNSAPAIARSVGSTPPALITANLTPKSSSSSRIPRSTNRQTVVSTGSSDIWPEPTTPSSASDTKRSFQSMGPGLGAVGDDPFARAPVYVTSDRKKEKEKERPPERVRKLGVSAGSDPLNEFPHPPRTPVISEPGPSRQLPSPRLSPSHLSPATLSPTSPGSHLSPQSSLPHLHISRKSSSSRLSPQSSSSHLSPQSSTSRLSPKSSFSHISSDSNLCPGSPSSSTPTTYTGSTLTTASPTSVIAIGSVSALDMHAHAHATQSYAYSPESSSLDELYTGKTLKAIKSAERLKAMSMDRIDDDDVLDPEIPGVAPSLGIRRGQSAHAVLSSRGAGVNMGSMLGIASGIVGGGPVEAFERAGAQSPVGPKKVPPKRPSRSELRERKSSPSLARHIVPPERHDSLRPVPSASSLLPPGSNGSSSFLPRSNGSSSFLPGSNGSSSFLPGSNGSSSFLPRSPGSSTLHPGSAGSRRGSGNDEGLLAVPAVSEHEVLPAVLPGSAAASSSNESTPVLGGSESRSNRSSPRASASNGSPHISSSNGSPHISTSNGSPHMSTSNGSPHISTSNGSTPNASAVSTPNASAPLRSPSLPRTRDVTPTPASPSKHSRLAVPRPQSPTPRSGEVADLNNYAFAPMGHEAENASINLTDLGIDYTDGESVLSDDDRLAVTFHHDDQRSKFAIARQRPPPSPTTLPFMAGNAGRRPRGRDMVYPSGVHIIPTAALRELARMGKEEDSARDAVVGRPVMEMEEEQADTPAALEEEQFPTPSASSPSPVNTLTRISSMSSRASSCSSVGPEAVPRTVSSHVAFSRHTRTGSYSDSELDWDLANEKRIKAKAATKTGITSSVQTAVAWRCGSGNHEKCCQTRALRDGLNMGRWKCCAERAAGKNARCCAAFVGRPCERPRVSSTSSASVHEAGWALKRQRSFHLSSFSGMASPLTSTSPQAGGLHANARRFFHRPHTSHGKSTSSALLDEETKAMISAKGPRMSKEDPGPQSTPDDLFSIPSVSSPPMSPLSRHEFKAQYIISPAQLRDHLKEARTPTIAPPAPPSEPGLRSPRMEPARQRSNTTTTNMTVTTSTTDTTGSVRSTFSSRSTDSQPPMRSLNPPRRNHNASLPVMTSSQPVPTTRRYVQSISSVTQPARPTAPPPPPRSPVGGLPPPPRGRANNTQPIVSFISPRTASGMSLRHQASLESCASASTVRRERPIPQRENQMSFLEFEVEEEGSEEEEEDESNWTNVDMAEQPIQSFLDLGRQSGDTMRESMAMFS